MKKLVAYFVRGCLILVPVAVTVYIITYVFKLIDRLVPSPVPGLGLLITLGAITVIGFLTSNVIGRGLFELTEALFTRLPLVKLLYTSIRDLVSAFVGDKRRFNRPVAVALSADGSVKLLGFVTRDDLAALGLSGSVAVYVPQSYNFSGNVLVVPAERVEALAAGTGELMTFIVSGGVSGFGQGQSPREPASSTNQ
jgi:uncharacterized membrane protein